MKKTDASKQKDYCDGYDYGFSHPHIAIKFAKRYAPTTCNNVSVWVEGFKDGKRATGLY